MGLFDRLRTQIENALARGTVPPTPREEAAALEESVVQVKLGLEDLKRARARTEAELAAQRTQLADAERRGELAAQIQDAETVRVASEFATTHRVKVTVLERKLAVQNDEVALAEKDAAELLERLRHAKRGLDAGAGAPRRKRRGAASRRPAGSARTPTSRANSSRPRPIAPRWKRRPTRSWRISRRNSARSKR